MAIDATGTPTDVVQIPKFNVSVDAPSGLGSNAQMDFIDDLLSGVKSLSTLGWGATPGGTSIDTTLSRISTGGLSTSSEFRTGGRIIAQLGTSNEVRMSDGIAGLTFGNAADVSLVRGGAAALWVQQPTVANGAGIAFGEAFATIGETSRQTYIGNNVSRKADNSGWQVQSPSSGLPEWLIQMGGTADDQFTIYRAPNTSGAPSFASLLALTNTGSLTLPNSGYVYVQNGSAGSIAFQTYVSGQGRERYIIQYDGKHLWGDGTNAEDTSISRSAANVLDFGNTITFPTALNVYGPAAGSNALQIRPWDNNATPTFLITSNGIMKWAALGGASDTNLYRISAGALASDGAIQGISGVITKVKAGAPVDGDIARAVDGALVVDTTNNKIWARVGGVWKGVVIA